MPVLTGDILMNLSTLAGSTGGAKLGSTVTSGVTNNVWPDISDALRLAGGDLYRKVFWSNNNASDPLILPVMYSSGLPTSQDLSLGLGFDSADDDNPAQGSMSAFSSAAKAEVVSDGTDSRVITIWGVDNAANPIDEAITLTGTTPVLSTTTFSKVWAVVAEATDVARQISINQGAGGALRGTIGAAELCCWLWVLNPDTKATGIALPDLEAGQSYGLWMKLSWLPGASPVRPNSVSARIEEA